MIKVEKIQIEEFRGLKNLTLEFNGKNYVICGPNGTGKSGVVDALEFALTGNISRLSGEGMGNVSVKEHAPHVDIRTNPEKARVVLTLKMPLLNNKEVVIERTVKNYSLPKVTPSSPEILEVLAQFNGHPEFVLSRREIIRYVISKPGNRSEEVQALLRLDRIGELRSNLKTLSNTYDRTARELERVKIQASKNLAQALGIIEFNKEKIVEEINIKRTILGLALLKDLTATTNLNAGLESSTKTASALKLNKISAMADLKLCSEIFKKIIAEANKVECESLKKQFTALANNPIITESASREIFLRMAIDFVTEEACPVCDAKWNIQELQSTIRAKLQKFEEITKTRTELERRVEPIISLIDEADDAIISLEKMARILTEEHVATLSAYRILLASYRKALKDFLPLSDAISAIDNVSIIPENISEAIKAIDSAITAIPEPTQQEGARDYIIKAQDRLEAYREAAREANKSKQQADLVKKVYDIYADVSNKALEKIYKDVEDEFSSLYRAVNNEDESDFTAKLTPATGKLGFDVNFYGRGYFPPGAYHSEGHQDAMGLCLYLALMRKLQGNNFRFAVFDDVLMSVDSSHRREVCNMLKQNFSDTQFVLTTHDEVWLKLMTTIGLITSGNATRFSNWTPDYGPAEWRLRDVWTEIDSALQKSDVHMAASLLRYYLEYIFKEICENLHARVEFRGDGRYELGDTLSPAVTQFRTLIKEGIKVAEAWGQTDTAEALRLREENVKTSLIATNAEQWQVNPAIHYNEWANFTVNDFIPVVAAFRDLVSKFFCEEQKCAGMFYLTLTPPKTPDALRCSCGRTNINLKKPTLNQNKLSAKSLSEVKK